MVVSQIIPWISTRGSTKLDRNTKLKEKIVDRERRDHHPRSSRNSLALGEKNHAQTITGNMGEELMEVDEDRSPKVSTSNILLYKPSGKISQRVNVEDI